MCKIGEYGGEYDVLWGFRLYATASSRRQSNVMPLAPIFPSASAPSRTASNRALSLSALRSATDAALTIRVTSGWCPALPLERGDATAGSGGSGLSGSRSSGSGPLVLALALPRDVKPFDGSGPASRSASARILRSCPSPYSRVRLRRANSAVAATSTSRPSASDFAAFIRSAILALKGPYHVRPAGIAST